MADIKQLSDKYSFHQALLDTELNMLFLKEKKIKRGINNNSKLILHSPIDVAQAQSVGKDSVFLA